MKRQKVQRAKVRPSSNKKRSTKKVKILTVKNAENWIETQFTGFLESKYGFYVKTAYVEEDMKRLNMVYTTNDTERESEPKQGYIYCKLWGSKKSKLYMYKGTKNRTKTERKIAKEVLKLLSPFIILVGVIAGVYIVNKVAETPEQSVVQMQEESMLEGEETQKEATQKSDDTDSETNAT